jgi:hypothetical protein
MFNSLIIIAYLNGEEFALPSQELLHPRRQCYHRLQDLDTRPRHRPEAHGARVLQAHVHLLEGETRTL